MLQITIPAMESYDELRNEFIVSSREYTIQLEHSLLSLSKWESIWNKPFLTKADKTRDESIDYVRCMTLTQNIPVEAYKFLTNDNLRSVVKYLESPMTATTFSKNANKATNNEVITSEIIYYWMIALNIPFECQKWHLNRLLTLINVCNVKNQPPKKTSKKDILSRNRELNAARKQQLNTKG